MDLQRGHENGEEHQKRGVVLRPTAPQQSLTFMQSSRLYHERIGKKREKKPIQQQLKVSYRGENRIVLACLAVYSEGRIFPWYQRQSSSSFVPGRSEFVCFMACVTLILPCLTLIEKNF